MTIDPFALSGNSLTAPAAQAFAIIPDDATSLDVATKAIFVGTGGDLAVRLVDNDEDLTFRNLGSGTILDIRVTDVRSSGTTATDLIGLI
ncbi:spike base protein, RCAP_Rcc01079 family [Aurantiacibacter marinus]|uniref:Uncharacterized protein n=1 Tax=Aurantiacibacter marinus TaxID=874156 RepID=A0A0H0XWF1_9SPHN|nr:hypothetical protein [Aurantiacibacter marinus]KLI64630.1 hypothetical protein AAV99_03490 [Aurantiacibacter marinus]